MFRIEQPTPAPTRLRTIAASAFCRTEFLSRGQITSARWLVLGENLIIVGLAVVTWHFFQPSLEFTRTLDFTWIAQMFLRNTVLILIVAGGLHWLLHARKIQGKRLKFDPQDMKSGERRFTLNSQLRDNMLWTLTSGVFFWTAFEALMLLTMANRYAPMLLWAQSPVWFVALFLLTPLWISFHFYWIHRFLHWPPLYKRAHGLHQRNTNIGPWSGLSMHPIEHILFFSSVLIHWILSAHPIHILFHMQHQAHSGPHVSRERQSCEAGTCKAPICWEMARQYKIHWGPLRSI